MDRLGYPITKLMSHSIVLARRKIATSTPPRRSSVTQQSLYPINFQIPRATRCAPSAPPTRPTAAATGLPRCRRRGRFRPSGQLSDFDGQLARGTWTLRVSDEVGGDSGAIVSWGINLHAGNGAHTYTWDTFASGFFGQSDDVVFRIEAYPSVRPSPN